MTSFLPDDVKWVKRPIIKMHDNPPSDSQWEYEVVMPSWLAEWDIYGDWEVERFDSMRDNLKQGDILFDIGAEVGWQSIIYAQFVGPGNMVLIEPTREFWPNIMHTWHHNFKVDPLHCHSGLVSDKTTGDYVLPKHKFPAEAEGELVDRLAYRYIHEHGLRMPQITIDDYCERTGITPDALTMDTEGAELRILKGAEQTLKANSLKVWVSIHPELGKQDYGDSAQDIHDFMKACGYSGTHLATDHEEHWYFIKGAK